MHSILVVVVLFGVAYGNKPISGLGAPMVMGTDAISEDTDLQAGLDMAVEKLNKDSGLAYR